MLTSGAAGKKPGPTRKNMICLRHKKWTNKGTPSAPVADKAERVFVESSGWLLLLGLLDCYFVLAVPVWLLGELP